MKALKFNKNFDDVSLFRVNPISAGGGVESNPPPGFPSSSP